MNDSPSPDDVNRPNWMPPVQPSTDRHQEPPPELVEARRQRAHAAVEAERFRSSLPAAPVLPEIGVGPASTTHRTGPGSVAVDVTNPGAFGPDGVGADLSPSDPAESGRERSGTPTWVKVAVPVAVIAVLGTTGLVLTGGRDEVASPPATSALPAVSTTVAPAPSSTTPATTTTTTTSIPATVATGESTHRAIYRDGKLYLEGTVPDQAAADAYIEKAAAVLGADNVVNNYSIDPSVPASSDGTVYVDEPFLFPTGSAEVDPQYYGVLNLGIAALNLTPDARMVVTGYTDDVGDPLKNIALSQARATAVVFYMISTGGIDPSRFDTVGAGQSNPVGDNATDLGRQMNRRIDVKLVDLLS